MKRTVSLNLVSLFLFAGVGIQEASARKLLTITLTNGEIHNFEPEKTNLSFANNKNLIIADNDSPETIVFPIEEIDNMFFTNVTGIEAIDTETYKISVSRHELMIRCSEPGEATIRIISSAGAEVLSSPFRLNEPVNISGLSSGAYLLIINNQYTKFIKP